MLRNCKSNGGRDVENERIIMDLLNRIICLEERVLELEKSSISINDKMVDGESSLKTISRKTAREYAIKQIKTNCPSFNNIKVASREKGSGIEMVLDDKKKSMKYPIGCKFYYSKEHGENRFWFRVDEVDTHSDDIHLFIFVMNHGGTYKSLIMTSAQFHKHRLAAKKIADKSKKFHMYFEIADNGEVVENRDEEIEVTKYFEDWSIPESLVRSH